MSDIPLETQLPVVINLNWPGLEIDEFPLFCPAVGFGVTVGATVGAMMAGGGVTIVTKDVFVRGGVAVNVAVDVAIDVAIIPVVVGAAVGAVVVVEIATKDVFVCGGVAVHVAVDVEVVLVVFGAVVGAVVVVAIVTRDVLVGGEVVNVTVGVAVVHGALDNASVIVWRDISPYPEAPAKESVAVVAVPICAGACHTMLLVVPDTSLYLIDCVPAHCAAFAPGVAENWGAVKAPIEA
jgi:hypothetical protein